MEIRNLCLPMCAVAMVASACATGRNGECEGVYIDGRCVVPDGGPGSDGGPMGIDGGDDGGPLDDASRIETGPPSEAGPPDDGGLPEDAEPPDDAEPPADGGGPDAGDPCAACAEIASCDPDADSPCSCPSGYEGDGTSCTDVDECERGTDDCDVHATCTNTEGSYECTCDDGYTGDGRTCEPVSGSGCADGTTEVEWSSEYHGCRGPVLTWLEYSERQHEFCAPGWVMANETVVNDVLTGPGYTEDIKYAFNGDTCTESEGWYFATRYDSYSQSRSECGWSDSHHWSLGDEPDTSSAEVEGIVCQRVPGAADLRYTGPDGPDLRGSGWVLCGHVPMGPDTVDPRSTDGVRACLVRGLRTFAVARAGGGICQEGNQSGWEYPEDDATVTLDWQLTNRSVSGWISPSHSGTNACGVYSSSAWDSTSSVQAYDTTDRRSAPQSWIYYHE